MSERTIYADENNYQWAWNEDKKHWENLDSTYSPRPIWRAQEHGSLTPRRVEQ